MKFYHVDSFADELFQGNPAGVCLLGDEINWMPDTLMQNIAGENNMSETAFVKKSNGELAIRWFTPAAEVDLCGHATLAAAHVLFNHEGVREKHIEFSSRSGLLGVNNEGDFLSLDFPRREVQRISFDEKLDCFNITPKEAWQGGGEYLLVFENETQVRNALCNLEKAARIDREGFIITAKSDSPEIDFVSRYFSPKFGINEDPVTGSAHTLIVPYWQTIFNKDTFTALQVSKRGGRLMCTVASDRIKIAGKAITYLVGELFV
jgi:PhzF family phenazine biosynthesis protein